MSAQKPCLFLDRDGVVIKNVPYSNNPGTVELLLGAAALLKTARGKGFRVIIVTNQSGIGRGLLNEDDYQAITERMLLFLKNEGAFVDRIYHAPYFHQSKNPEHLKNPHWRKPGAGMFEQACADFEIDLKNSIMIGDRASDMEAAQKAGVARKILLHSIEHAKESELIPSEISYEFVNSLTDIQL